MSGKAFEVSFQNDSCFLRITSSEFLEPSSWVISDHLFCEREYLKSAKLYLGQPIFTSRQAFVFRKVTSALKAQEAFMGSAVLEDSEVFVSSLLLPPEMPF